MTPVEIYEEKFCHTMANNTFSTHNIVKFLISHPSFTMLLDLLLRDVGSWRNRCLQRVCNGVLRKMLYRERAAKEQVGAKHVWISKGDLSVQAE